MNFNETNNLNKEAIIMDNNSSTQKGKAIHSQPLILQSKQEFRKNSEYENRSRKSSLMSINEVNQKDTGNKYSNNSLSQNSPIIHNKALSNKNNEQTIHQSLFNGETYRQNPMLQTKRQQQQKRNYLANKVTPVLNKMLVKIVNDKPNKLLDFMIQYLRNQQDKYQTKRFNDKANNNVINEQKNFQELFDSTVATKFLKFQK